MNGRKREFGRLMLLLACLDHEDASIRFAFGSARILELCWQSSLAEPAISGARHELTTWLAEQFLASLDETRCHLFFTVFGCI